MFGDVCNLRSSPHLVAVWAAFARAVAVPWRFGVLFAFGVAAGRWCVLAAHCRPDLAGGQGTTGWRVWERPELVALPATLLLMSSPA